MRAPRWGSAAVVAAVLVWGCAGSSSSPTTPSVALTPARSLEGVWTTPFPVTFIYQTDFCGPRQNVAQAQWHVSWTIEAVEGYSNVIDIQMNLSRGGSTPIGSCQPNGWVPPAPPLFLRLCLSASSVTRCAPDSYPSGYAFGDFTTDILTLTWTHWECLLYCFGEYTAENALRLTRAR